MGEEQYLTVKNWGEYQHYKDRCPPWIKLHAKILNDKVFASLSCASRGLLMQLWILASENEGKVKNDLDEIKFRLRDNSIKQDQINLLIKKGFLIPSKQTLADASTAQAGAVPEERREEGEKRQSAFDEFWKEYPKKRSKGDALKAWKTIGPVREKVAQIMQGLSRAKKSQDWLKDNGQFIPYPATWLRAQGWEDEAEVELTSTQPSFKPCAICNKPGKFMVSGKGYCSDECYNKRDDLFGGVGRGIE